MAITIVPLDGQVKAFVNGTTKYQPLNNLEVRTSLILLW
jgi:hypothetical protein